MPARPEASAAHPTAPEGSGRLVTATRGYIRPASPGDVLALTQLTPAQRERHRHSPVSPNGMGGPVDFSLNGVRYSLDGLNTGHLGVAFTDTALGGSPQGLPLAPAQDRIGHAEAVTPPSPDNGERKKHRLSAEQAIAKLYSYLDKPQTRYDLEKDRGIQVLREGIKGFKEYNKHRQPEDDTSEDGNGAIGFGDNEEFRVPNHNRYPLLFPHDTRVMSLPDAFTPEGRKLTESALDKMVKLYNKYGIIPNYNALSGLNVPARPVFLSTAFEWYMTHPDKDSPHVKEKFKTYAQIGAAEHDRIWNNPRDLTGAMGTSHAMVPGYTWLRKAGDMDTGKNAYNASRVIGWDESTTRFGGREDAYLPVCINAQLYRNKQILAFAAEELGMPLRGRDAEGWRQAAHEMAEEMYAQQFDPARGIHVDRDFEYDERSQIVTLASAWTLHAGIPTGKDALSTIGQLSYLDSGNGLLTTHPKDAIGKISADKLRAAGADDDRTIRKNEQFHQIRNWDERLWPIEEVAANEGLVNYVLSNDKGLTLQDRLAINRFAQKIVHDQLQHQIDKFLETGKFGEKYLANGEIDHGAHQYEPQVDGLGATPAMAELNIDLFLPILYRSEEALLQAIERGERDVDLTGIRMEVIREVQERQSDKGNVESEDMRRGKETAAALPAAGDLVTFTR